MIQPSNRTQYGSLFEPATGMWPRGSIDFTFDTVEADPALVSNVSAVCFVGDQVLVLETEEFGVSPLIGGTLDEGEAPLDGLRRELMEEAGAQLVHYSPIGRVDYHYGADTPHRPHIPHPNFQRLVGWADVEIIAEPQLVEGGEHVIAVHRLSPAAAKSLVATADPWHAELLTLATDLRRAARSIR